MMPCAASRCMPYQTGDCTVFHLPHPHPCSHASMHRGRAVQHAARSGALPCQRGLTQGLRQHLHTCKSVNDNESQTDRGNGLHEQQSSQQTPGEASLPGWAQALLRKWSELDPLQRVYTVVVAIAVLGALPRILTLVVLGAERVVIGGLLAAEEALLELLFRGGALVGAIGAVGLLLAGVYLFLVPRASK